MKINFTKKEFRDLLELIGLTEWMMNAHLVGDAPQYDRYAPLVQKLFALAEEMGCEDCVHHSRKLGRFVPSDELHDNERFRAIIENYDFHNFWSGLADRLAVRDAKRLHGEALSQMSGADRVEAIAEFEDQWIKEFEKHGLERIGVLK
ncbi:MAG: hypothetical protein R3200_09510 [Xanthomonadales bacterium]|nr:hypothetical protein [Xanthomonadales bacterium]